MSADRRGLERPVEGPGATRPLVSRELSLLAFNARVLHEANDVRNPLLSRLRFLGIVASNLDEFFAVRVAAVRAQIGAGVTRPGPDGRTPQELLDAIGDAVRLLSDAEQKTWRRLVAEMAAAGHRIASWRSLDAPERASLSARYAREIHPLLVPVAIQRDQPLPYIGALDGSILVQLAALDGSTAPDLARVKLPSLLGRVSLLPDGRVLPIEELVRANVGSLFPGREVLAAHLFRVTRNAEIDIDVGSEGGVAPSDDLIATIEEELQQRRFGAVVRLEIESSVPHLVCAELMKGLGIDRTALFAIDGVVDLTIATAISALPLSGLVVEPLRPVIPTRISTAPRARDGGANLFAVIAASDLLLHHPYESFDASVDRLFAQAADDPDVLSIRTTLYRTGGAAGIPTHLIRAAEAGKEVVVLVEPKARFDEAANIEWGRRLEAAGAQVIYGVMGLKTHCKATLILRSEGDEIRSYVHLGTGNYNPITARSYTDLGLFTANEEIGSDVGELFNYLTGRSLQLHYRRLLVAPLDLRLGLEARIDAAIAAVAAGGRASIAIKVNALVDAPMISLLDRAAASGVEVDLIVRGACCLLPDPTRHRGRLRIRSIIGSFLEHSRIYRFSIDGRVELLAGSADLMERNLDRRVEVLFPLLDPDVRAQAEKIVDGCLANLRNAWILQPDGAWLRAESATVVL